MLNKIVILILFSLINFAAIATDQAETMFIEDSLNVEALNNDIKTNNIRNFDETQLEKYKKKREFQYNFGKEKENGISNYLKSLLAKLLDWIFGSVTETDYNWELAGKIMTATKFLFWLTAIALLIYGVLKILGLDFTSLFYKTADVNPTIQFETIDEDIHEIDFNKSIEEAIANKNYRYAIRMYYLKTLKLLSDKELINWQKDKTNADYVFEVSETEFNANFKNITKLFNYSWYGEVLLNTDTFDMAQQNFTNFFNQLNLHNA